MADINHVISLGIGSPAGISEFLTFGLQIGASIVPTVPGAEFTVPRSTAEFTVRRSAAAFTVPRQRADFTVRGDN